MNEVTHLFIGGQEWGFRIKQLFDDTSISSQLKKKNKF